MNHDTCLSALSKWCVISRCGLRTWHWFLPLTAVKFASYSNTREQKQRQPRLQREQTWRVRLKTIIFCTCVILFDTFLCPPLQAATKQQREMTNFRSFLEHITGFLVLFGLLLLLLLLLLLFIYLFLFIYFFCHYLLNLDTVLAR